MGRCHSSSRSGCGGKAADVDDVAQDTSGAVGLSPYRSIRPVPGASIAWRSCLSLSLSLRSKAASSVISSAASLRRVPSPRCHEGEPRPADGLPRSILAALG